MKPSQALTHSCCVDFLTEYWGDDFFYPIRDLKKIAMRYIKYD